MNRDTSIETLKGRDEPFDILVIGGGSTGAGVALDAALRGYSVALIERGDFAGGTSSKSTKLIHGGLRYLKQGNISLVRESLRERERLLRNAPSLVTPLGFVIPCYERWTSFQYAVGLKLYDALSGSKTLAKARGLSAEEVARVLPRVRETGLRSGRLYFDAQFDDAGLVLALVSASVDAGAVASNYVGATGLLKDSNGRVMGVQAKDEETGEAFEIRAKAVVNAAGPWADSVRRMDDESSPEMIVPSQGTHLVFDREVMGSDHALMIPKTKDGRILFAIPFQGSLIVGTTDTKLPSMPDEPVAQNSEISFILETLNPYLREPVSREDVRAVFTGVRPLVRSGESQDTSKIARNHVVRVSKGSSLVTVTGGKWTTYRQIAEDAVDRAAGVAGLESRPCETADHSLEPHVPPDVERSADERIDRRINLSEADVQRMVDHEMALHVEDVLARRRRALILDARACADVAPTVAGLIANRRGLDVEWADRETERFQAAVGHALPA